MNPQIQKIVDKSFIDIARTAIGIGSIGLLIPVDNRWEYPLPTHLQKEVEFVLEIKGWSYEETTYDETEIEVVVAFGEQENSATFEWREILGIFNDKLEPIIFRSFISDEQKQYTLNDILRKGD